MSQTRNQNPEPAYMPLVRELAARGEFPPGVVTVVEVAHDDCCDIWDGKPCNCEPVIVTPRACP